LVAPLSRRTWSIANDKHHLQLHIQCGLAYYHFCRPHQSLTIDIRGPSKRRYRTPVMAANLVRRCWLGNAGFVAAIGAGRDLVGHLPGYEGLPMN